MIGYSIILCSLIALSSSQYQRSSKDAAILSEARYQAVNGQFGSSYKQEDGVEVKEESDDQGNRRGSYSYVDPTGVRRTVTYTAGKDGFRATGDHIPVTPPPLKVSAASTPSSESYNSNYDYDDSPSKYDNSQSKYDQDQYNNYDSYYHVPSPNSLLAQPQQQFNPAPEHKPAPRPQYSPQQFQYQSPAAPIRPALAANAAPSYNQYNTESSSHRFQSPGKLNLNRSPDGFTYTFTNV